VATRAVPSKHMGDLRRQAEKMISGGRNSVEKLSVIETRRLIHELQVHKIELEMQNEAFQDLQIKNTALQGKYADLYDFSPVGYFTLDKKGQINEGNATGASLFGCEKRSLTGQPFHRFILPAHFAVFQSCLHKVLETKSKQTCKLRIVKKDGHQFDAMVETIIGLDSDGHFDHYRSSVTDITEQRLAEVRYRAIINSAIDGFWLTDCEGNLRDVSDAYCALTGYTREELLQMTISDLEAVETPSDTVKHIRHVMKAGCSRFETRHRCKDGRIVDLEVSVSFADIEGGVLFIHLRDISRRKKRDREIKRNEERLECLLKISGHEPASVKDLLDYTLNEAIVLTESKLGYIYLYDDETQQYEINDWSREAMAECRIAEINTVYHLGKTGIWGEDVRYGKPIMVNDCQASHPLKTDYSQGHAVLYRYLTIPISSDDRIVAVLGVANKTADYDEADIRQLTLLMNSAWKIVEWKRAEDALKISETRYRRLFETAQDGILIIDLETEKITDVNPFLMNILGYPKGELLGKHLWDIGVFKDTAMSKAAFEELKSKGYIRYEDLPLETKDGRSIHLEFISNVYEVDHNKVIQCNIRDITSRKRAERALQEKTAQLEDANKELESFSYSVSHDLRAPLRAIEGYSRMILKKQGDRFDDDTRSKFDVIRNNTRLMGQLIDDLLSFSRTGKQQMNLSKLDMDKLFKAVWEELKSANPGRDMTMVIGGMPPVLGDRSLMKQVVINLLSNAVKFTKHLDDARLEAGAFAVGDEIVFYLKDNGAGFDMQYHDKLFGVFQRLHREEEYEGTGVGLAIVQRIIHRHGGRLWAESEINRGACFYFTMQRFTDV
jgi:PAS domain S-box-containing protein